MKLSVKLKGENKVSDPPDKYYKKKIVLDKS